MIPLSEYAKETSIPKRILRYLEREGIINDPLSREDQLCLQFLEKIWGKKEILRAQLSRLSLKARHSFLRTADLPTKWERYASSRYFNLVPGQKLEINTLIEEIQTTFCFLLTRQQIKRLYKIRNRVQVAKHREKKRADKQPDSSLT
jgi:DNA-binding transcriptional MerR regulator